MNWKICPALSDDKHLVIDRGFGKGCVLIARGTTFTDMRQDDKDGLLIQSAHEMLDTIKDAYAWLLAWEVQHTGKPEEKAISGVREKLAVMIHRADGNDEKFESITAIVRAVLTDGARVEEWKRDGESSGL